MSILHPLTGVSDADIEILARMPDKDFENTCKTSKYFQSLCKGNQLWRLRFLYKYNLEDFKIVSNITFEELYKILKDKTKEQALVWAVENSYLEVIGFLLYRGANINFDNNFALLKSVLIGNLEVVELLLDNITSRIFIFAFTLKYAARYLIFV